MENFDLNFCSNFYSTFNVTKCTVITIKLLMKEVKLEHSLPLLQVNTGNSAKAHCQNFLKHLFCTVHYIFHYTCS